MIIKYLLERNPFFKGVLSPILPPPSYHCRCAIVPQRNGKTFAFVCFSRLDPNVLTSSAPTTRNFKAAEHDRTTVLSVDGTWREFREKTHAKRHRLRELPPIAHFARIVFDISTRRHFHFKDHAIPTFVALYVDPAWITQKHDHQFKTWSRSHHLGESVAQNGIVGR